MVSCSRIWSNRFYGKISEVFFSPKVWAINGSAFIGGDARPLSQLCHVLLRQSYPSSCIFAAADRSVSPAASRSDFSLAANSSLYDCAFAARSLTALPGDCFFFGMVDSVAVAATITCRLSSDSATRSALALIALALPVVSILDSPAVRR